MEPTIRPVTAADITTVHRIEVASYPDPWPRSIFFLMRGRAPEFFLVAEAEGAVVGYAIGEVEWREGVRVGHVMNIAVADEWRRRGLAGRLLDELEGRFSERRAEFSYLEVRVGNTPAQSLYGKRGYVEVGRLSGYYRDEDGLAMEKPLG
ncbi:MAG: ribosomal protein S18-alanine N-acetyltransferase [Candidatus Bathyarchaeota archaeon]|nr:ribosomal protein S18-alanine N-acetyltransferase [Candidatus Bathyarchaeota archaeon]